MDLLSVYSLAGRGRLTDNDLLVFRTPMLVASQFDINKIS